MNIYFWYFGVVGIVAVVILTSVYLKFRDGLATKMYGAICALLYFSSGMSLIVGVEQTPTVLVVCVVLGASVIVPSLYFLYRVVVTRLETQTQVLLRSTNDLSATAKETSATAAQQSATVSEISSTISELTETSSAAAAFAKQVVSASADVLAKGEEGMKAVEAARNVLDLISQVSEIVEAIRDFAGQSNLLAVNARVEAAKAGEHGRGFAVVASEVRNLAEQSRDSAQRIWRAVNQAEEGRRSLEEASTRMRELLAALSSSVDSAQQIAATVGQQSAGIQQISEAMNNVAEGGKASAMATEQVEEAVASLRTVTEQLQVYVSGAQR